MVKDFMSFANNYTIKSDKLMKLVNSTINNQIVNSYTLNFKTPSRFILSKLQTQPSLQTYKTKKHERLI